MALLDSNVKARAGFFTTWLCLTRKQVSEAAGHGSKHQRSTISRWKGNQKIFSVIHGGVEYFPAFQFQDGQPHETIARVLQILGSRKSEWQLAFWFTSPNGWLDGKKPANCLNEAEAVVTAAVEEAKPILGWADADKVESVCVGSLTAYKTAERKNPQMSVVAQTLGEEDIANLAAYYASIKISVQKP
jgi:hypothetical protein